jgi:hypothetical protein
VSRCVVVDFTPLAWASAWRGRPEVRRFVPLLERLADPRDWPEVAAYRALLGADVDFVVPGGRLPAGLDASDVDDSYIGHCVRGAVPTRPRNLHDLMNALTWAAYPRAKLALCRRQVEVARARGPRTNRLRTKAQDRLAMLDEGGLLALPDGDERVFGHGLLEDLVLGRSSRGFPVGVPVDDDATVGDAVTALDLPTDVALSPAAR